MLLDKNGWIIMLVYSLSQVNWSHVIFWEGRLIFSGKRSEANQSFHSKIKSTKALLDSNLVPFQPRIYGEGQLIEPSYIQWLPFLGSGPDVAELNGDQPHISEHLCQSFRDVRQLPWGRHQLCLSRRQYWHRHHDGLLSQEDETCHLCSSPHIWSHLHCLHADYRGVHHLQRSRYFQRSSFIPACPWHQSLLRLCSHRFWICRRALLSNCWGNDRWVFYYVVAWSLHVLPSQEPGSPSGSTCSLLSFFSYSRFQM